MFSTAVIFLLFVLDIKRERAEKKCLLKTWKGKILRQRHNSNEIRCGTSKKCFILLMQSITKNQGISVTIPFMSPRRFTRISLKRCWKASILKDFIDRSSCFASQLSRKRDSDEIRRLRRSQSWMYCATLNQLSRSL